LVTVTSVLRRAVAPFAAVTALVATLSACGTGPSQVNSAVILDDRVISVDEVQGLVDKVVREPAAKGLAQQHKLDLVAREAVTQLVTHRLLTEVAREENLRVDPKELADFKEQNPIDQELPTDGSAPAEQLIPLLVYRARGFDAFANDYLLLGQLAKEYLGRVNVKANVASFPLEDFDAAKALAEKVAANPDDGAKLIEGASSETGQSQLDIETGANELALQLKAPDDSVFVMNQPASQQSAGSYFVVQVLSTEVASEPSAEMDLSQVDQGTLAQVGKFLLRDKLLDSGISVSPRFGVWNSFEMKVLPKSESDVAGMLLLPRADRP
jgi:hypothetical protein